MNENTMKLESYCRNGTDYVKCPSCGCELRIRNAPGHLRKVHHMQRVSDGFIDNKSSTKIVLPVIPKFLSKKHSSALRKLQAKILAKHGLSKPTPAKQINIEPTVNADTSQSDAARQLEQIQKPPTDNDQINDFIKRNPAPDELGKFGKPQDPYRRGAYGTRSMEYDVTRERKD